MPKIVPIVEGDGEVEALPELIRKILREYPENPRWDISIASAKNAHGVGRLTVVGGLERFLQYAFSEPNAAGVIVLLDADANCPKELAKQLADRARALNPRIPVAIVIAKCEYEAWFLASLVTIAGHDLDGRPGIPTGTSCDDPEAIGDVKGWISRQIPGSRIYKESLDQSAMTKLIDIGLARQNSRSFHRLCAATTELCSALDNGIVTVTPVISD